MTTATTTTRIRHDSDATFREWGLEFQTQLLAAGLAANELTTNWATATRPGLDTEYGYEVYHLNDSLHGTAPIYIRFGYGTGPSSLNQPALTVTVGTTTNGSGVLGGNVVRSIVRLSSGGAETTDTTYVSRWVAVSGFFGLWYKTGSGSAAAFLAVGRTSNYTGTPSAQSFTVIYSSVPVGGARVLTGRNDNTFLLADGGSGTAPNALTFDPQGQDTGALSDKTIYPAAVIDPARRWLPGIVGRHASDGFSPGSTFTANDIGGNSHTYIALSTSSPGLIMDQNSTIRYCMLWE